MNEIIKNFEAKIGDTNLWLEAELSKVRTGRATPSFLDNIKIDQYGAMTPLNQVASIGAEDARTLRVSPWDTSLISTIDNVISRQDLGVSTSSDEKGVRIHFPELTSETREKIAKQAKQKHEEARVALRSARDDSRNETISAQKRNELSEDESRALLEKIDSRTVDTNKVFDKMYEDKYQELTKI